jgi:hypothetical protein
MIQAPGVSNSNLKTLFSAKKYILLSWEKIVSIRIINK